MEKRLFFRAATAGLGNTARAATAGLGSKGLSFVIYLQRNAIKLNDNDHVSKGTCWCVLFICYLYCGIFIRYGTQKRIMMTISITIYV